MKLPRRRYWIPLVLVVLFFAIARFDLHLHILGWFRGDAYYQGMPTTYWRDVANPNRMALPDWVPFASRFRRTDWDERIRKLFSDADAEPVLIQLAEDRSTLAVIRLRALSSLRRWDEEKVWCSPEARAAASRCLSDPDIELRRIAAHILLIGQDSQEARMLLLTEGENRLRDPNPFARIAAIHDIGSLALSYNMDPADISRRIRPFLEDKDGRVRDIAKFNLDAIKKRQDGMLS